MFWREWDHLDGVWRYHAPSEDDGFLCVEIELYVANQQQNKYALVGQRSSYTENTTYYNSQLMSRDEIFNLVDEGYVLYHSSQCMYDSGMFGLVSAIDFERTNELYYRAPAKGGAFVLAPLHVQYILVKEKDHARS